MKNPNSNGTHIQTKPSALQNIFPKMLNTMGNFLLWGSKLIIPNPLQDKNTCHMSPVMCHLSDFLFFFCLITKKKNKKERKKGFTKLDKGVELVGGGSVIIGAYPF